MQARPVRFFLTLLFLVTLGVSTAQSQVRALFSPWDDIEGALLAVIGKATKMIRVHAYLLTSRPVTQALLAARQRGVDVQLMADAGMSKRGAEEQLRVLADNGVPVWMETRYAAAHNKVLIIDSAGERPVAVTGSYNFTWSAQARNAENVLIVEQDGELVRQYADNWRRHQGEAMSYANWVASGRPTPQEGRHAK